MDFGDLADKAKDLASEHADQAKGALDQAADFVDDKTGGRFSDQIEQGKGMVADQLGVDGENDAAQQADNQQEQAGN